MNLPTPAVVAERSTHPIPRWALLLLCAAYVLPGLFGRDPWRNADLTAFGFIASIAQGHAPVAAARSIAGLPADGGLLPYWVGALGVKLLRFLDPSVAARIPFGLMLAAVLALAWYSCLPPGAHRGRATGGLRLRRRGPRGRLRPRHGRRLPARADRQPGTAAPGARDHAGDPPAARHHAVRLQPCGAALPGLEGRTAMLVALPVLATSGAPVVALALTVRRPVAVLPFHLRGRPQVPALDPRRDGAGRAGRMADAWLGLAREGQRTQRAGLVAGSWRWFCWPAWPLAAWSLWRWRAHLMRRHLSVPLLASLVPLLTSLLMGADDRAMLLALPPLAVLASFALPTFQRSASALLDWFSVFFFTVGAIFLWLYYMALQIGWPAKLLANVRKLAQGYEPQFSLLTFVVAVLGTLAWLWLVQLAHCAAPSRALEEPRAAGRRRGAGLAAGDDTGTAHAELRAQQQAADRPHRRACAGERRVHRRSRRPDPCLGGPGVPRPLEGRRDTGPRPHDLPPCDHRAGGEHPMPPSGWRVLGVVRRPTDRFGTYLVMQKDR